MAATEPLPLMDSEVSDSNQRLAENLGIKPIFSLTTRISIEYEQINTSNIIILFLAFFLLIGVAIYLHNKSEVPLGF